MLLRYGAALAKRNLDSPEFVFKNLSFSTSKGHSLRSGTSLSYTRAEVVNVLAKFRAIGRWRSDSAKKLYCRESLRRQLLATSCIGL